MAENYTGDPAATQSPSATPGSGVAPIVSLPQDGMEDVNTASVSQAFKVLADFVAWLTAHGTWRDIASTITALWTFNAATDTSGVITASDIISGTRRLWAVLPLGSGIWARLYRLKSSGSPAIGGWEIVVNASFSGSTWTQDVSASPAARWRLLNNTSFNVIEIHRYTGAVPWAEGSWTSYVQMGPSAAGTLTLGNLVATLITCAGVASSANVTITGADIVARRAVSNGTAVIAGNITLGSGWGATATRLIASGSTDWKGSVNITANGTGISLNPRLTLTFMDGAWNATPLTLAWIIDTGLGSSAVPQLLLPGTISTTQAEWIWSGQTPIASRVYRVGWQHFG